MISLGFIRKKVFIQTRIKFYLKEKTFFGKDVIIAMVLGN